MSDALTLARPYARAAFALAREHAQLPQWSQQLGVAAQLASDPAAHALLGNPSLSAADAQALVLPPGDVAPQFAAFVQELAAHGRLALLPEIAALYEQARAEAEHVVKATITSAAPLDADELARLKSALKARFGSEVEVATAIDPALIGGAVIDAGDVVIDGSVRSKLERLQSALAQ